jgi:hypothetical protein
MRQLLASDLLINVENVIFQDCGVFIVTWENWGLAYKESDSETSREE